MSLPDLILLAGGQGSRMGGDKLRLRDAHDCLLVARWFERLHWPAFPRLILPPGGTAPDEIADWPRAHDAVAHEGPLRGVEAALAATSANWLIVVAVDTPGIGRAQLDWLADQRSQDPDARLWMTRRAGEIEPFPLLIHRDVAGVVSRRLVEKRRSLHGLASEPLARIVEPPDWPASVNWNLNYPADLAAYLETLEAR